jgi:hypothetical protein
MRDSMDIIKLLDLQLSAPHCNHQCTNTAAYLVGRISTDVIKLLDLQLSAPHRNHQYTNTAAY